MAITSAEMQAALGTEAMGPRVLRAGEVQGSDASKQEWYVSGGVSAPGRVRWCSTTAADNAATQAASVLTQLRA